MTDSGELGEPAQPGGSGPVTAPAFGWPQMAGFGAPPAPAPGPRWLTRAEVVPAVVTVVLAAVVGVPVGFAWAASSPRLNVGLALGGGAESAFQVQAGDDVHFAVASLVAGVVVGLLAGLFARRASWLAPLALAVGGMAGAVIASLLGHALVNSHILDQVRAHAPDLAQRSGDLFDFKLRAIGFLVVYPLAALVVFLLFVVLGTRREEPPARPGSPPGSPAGGPLAAAPTDGRWWAAPR